MENEKELDPELLETTNEALSDEALDNASVGGGNGFNIQTDRPCPICETLLMKAAPEINLSNRSSYLCKRCHFSFRA